MAYWFKKGNNFVKVEAETLEKAKEWVIIYLKSNSKKFKNESIKNIKLLTDEEFENHNNEQIKKEAKKFHVTDDGLWVCHNILNKKNIKDNDMVSVFNLNKSDDYYVFFRTYSTDYQHRDSGNFYSLKHVLNLIISQSSDDEYEFGSYFHIYDVKNKNIKPITFEILYSVKLNDQVYEVKESDF